ncbi:mechanosensitive ion channel family protein [Christiangramia forsetii]|uniref:Small-conductance mechanosensitive ion channel protein n=2 Tax=Christiangramia forsetii TaxID=411153 RepID=A0M4H7_CHRFK|nr:mechanosensitive ion channel family protein [Christiangramia forsetii]GGG23444.1 transporter [Christiangramia forsetii]CAL67522.1 small-conductance mechanosensitive ion channel protein [Christiangramia forsetii KT0803]
MLTIFLQDDETPKDQTGEIDVNTQSMVEKIDTWLDGFIRNVPNIVIGIALFIAMIYVGRWAGRLVKKQMSKRGRDNFGEILGGFLKYTIVIVGLMLALTVISPNLKPADLIAGLGVSSVAIGFAFKDILQNWLAGILILLRQPFKIGDQIVVNGYEGTVDRIETRATIITTYDGQDVVIPNGDIYTNAVQVKTAHHLIRSQYDLGLGYDQDRNKAMKILRDTIEGIEGVNKDKPIDILPWDQSDSWLTIRMRWWTNSERADVVKIFSKVILETQNAMDKAEIDLPFPTHVEISEKLEELDTEAEKPAKETQ